MGIKITAFFLFLNHLTGEVEYSQVKPKKKDSTVIGQIFSDGTARIDEKTFQACDIVDTGGLFKVVTAAFQEIGAEAPAVAAQMLLAEGEAWGLVRRPIP